MRSVIELELILRKNTAKLKALGQALHSVAAQPIRIEMSSAGGDADRTEAEAIKRGQRPETIAALRRAISS